ncbi:hypothetical protein FHS25_006625 [Rhizobium laguerreae]|uniref:Type II toxin-antitoxin system ParD family antitoxin n=1 Tax=Rhizobium laguerreae TaxID=1076926 RepID=A0ABR6GIP2_9HYPH|nr:hypothetical protein [Rhizobium laguerreae]
MACCTSLFCPSSCHIDELSSPSLTTGSAAIERLDLSGFERCGHYWTRSPSELRAALATSLQDGLMSGEADERVRQVRAELPFSGESGGGMIEGELYRALHRPSAR